MTAQGRPSGVAQARAAVVACDVQRDLVTVSGPDAVEFLQGQVSAEVTTLGAGESTWALLLEPQGRVTAWCRVTRSGDAELLLDTDGGWGDVVIARLRRFLLRVDVVVEARPSRWIALRGPASTDVAHAAAPEATVREIEVDWRGLPGVDLLFGPAAGEVDLAGVARVGPDVLEVLRVEQGWPEMGRELDASTIPAEAGDWLIDASVSFTKGCYTGQELVARIHSRNAATPRRLRGLVIDGADVPEPGAAVFADGVQRATVTSSVRSPGVGAPIALAMLHRSVEVGSTVEVGGASATVVELPFTTAGG